MGGIYEAATSHAGLPAVALAKAGEIHQWFLKV